MARFGVKPGDEAFIFADATQMMSRPATLLDGPVVGYMEMSIADLPDETRLYGYVWTASDRVIIRYHEAQFPDGSRIPFCAIARDRATGLLKDPDSPPGTALVEDAATGLRIVSSFP